MNKTTIKHLRNSCIDIINSEIRILMDPWIYTANEGSWAGSNGYKYIFKSVKKKNIDYVYISHLHTDHFDEKFLKLLQKKQKKRIKIIVKKFKDNRLKNQLLKLGFEKIIDIDSFETLKLSKNCNFIILPQISASNSPNEYVNYDLDTSCIYFDKNVNVYNQVDNPYSIKDIKFIKKKLKEKKIDINFDLAFIPYCAASEYPQSFIDRDRNKAKIAIIDKGLNKFFKTAQTLKCKNLIPAGGSYKLEGIFSKLNRYLAVPDYKIIKKNSKKINIKNYILRNTKKEYFEIENHKIISKKVDYLKYFDDIITSKNKSTSYLKIKEKFKKDFLLRDIRNAEKNFPDFKKKLYNSTKTNIELCIWDKQPISIKNIKNKTPKINHKIFFGTTKNITLKIHLYYKLLIGLINKDLSWNAVQNHCLYERYPDVYDPDTVFWMNLYKNKFKNS